MEQFTKPAEGRTTARNRGRPTWACKFRVPLEAFEDSKTIRQRPDDRTPAEERFVLCSEPAAFS